MNMSYQMSKVKSSKKKLSWGTPIKYVKLVKDFFGGDIDLDPCSNEHSIVGAINEISLPMDGLKIEWNQNRVFLNPPYGFDVERKTSIKNWILKAKEEHIKNKNEILALIPVATNTQHWKDGIWGFANSICFLFDTRLRFLEDGKEGGKGAPMACCIVYWGNDYERFEEHFYPYGTVLDIRNIKKGKP